MRRRRMLTAFAAGASVLGLVRPAAVGVAAAQPAPAATVTLRSTSLGKILVNRSGRTLYEFSLSSRGKEACAAARGCLRVWPALIANGRSIAGPGVKASLLGTVKLPDGRRQVTYAGHPLHTYTGDIAPGATDYVGIKDFGGRWFALNAAGKVVK